MKNIRALCTAITRRYQCAIEPVHTLSGGEECEIWLVNSDNGPLIVRISPNWRSIIQLDWTHRLLHSIRSLLPVVIAPLKAVDGSSFFLYTDRVVALIPFIDGHVLDREQPAHRQAAARLLAHLHRTMLAMNCVESQLHRNLSEYANLPYDTVLGFLNDPALDAWNEALLLQKSTMTVGPIHGDYHRRNMLMRNNSIVGVVDWDNAHIDFLMQEVAWSAWEFCKNVTGDDWYPDRVDAFLQAYRDAGGPCNAEEYKLLVPFVRWRLRDEVRYNLASATAGRYWDADYVECITRAFQHLRSVQ